MPLIGGPLIRIARLRAGMTQRELAERLSLPQSSIARWESGARQPTIENCIEAVRACGLDPVVSLHPMDRSNDAFVWELLDESPAERLRVQVAAANATDRLRPSDGSTKAAPEFDPLVLMRALAARDLSYVLVGRLAENVRGAPIVPAGEVVICPRASDHDVGALDRALSDLGVADVRFRGGPERVWVEAAGATLVVAPVPQGTTGYGDLIRHATDEAVAADLSVTVGALVDLLRIADAAIEPSERVALPTLRRAYELTESYVAPAERPVTIPSGLEQLLADHGITGS